MADLAHGFVFGVGALLGLVTAFSILLVVFGCVGAHHVRLIRRGGSDAHF